MPADRNIRVFVSSTFRDMQEDRDYLVKFIFPQLRKLCEARGVTWGEVDLRWGITDEESAEGRVLPLCLEEIQRCRPYFIGMLGERYGWVPKPEEIPDDLVERQQWLKDHVTCSVTELEILHGVLREEAMHDCAFFYFRNPSYLDRLPSGRNRSDFQSESPEDGAKLQRLKQRIRTARDEDVCRLREDYHDAEQLGKWILADFTELIERVYPVKDQPDALAREAGEHEAFARSRRGVYIGRQAYFDRLDAHVADDGPPLIVLGESGLGKSALLANWFLDYREKHPKDFALIHFIGSTSDSADATRVMQRIMLELKRRFDLTDDVPVTPDQIREAFPQWLDKVAGEGRVVLVLDALNQLEDRDNAPDLGWLPVVMARNCRVILSALPGRSLDAVRRREWPEMTVEPLVAWERAELIAKFLAQFSRRLGTARVEHISQAEQSANPLFLRALLDELRQFGEHERLDERIEHYLAAADPGALYERILDRWQKDYGRDLVRRSLSLLWAARRGLSETELLDLLGDGESPLPRAKWTPFFLAVESSLAERSGLLGFFHSYVRDAVQALFVTTVEQKKSNHRALANYFAAESEMTPRKSVEWPWQLQEAQQWDLLRKALINRQLFQALFKNQLDVELGAYWLRLREARPSLEMGRLYLDAFTSWSKEEQIPESIKLLAEQLGSFLQVSALYEEADPLFRRALVLCEQVYGPDHPELANSFNHLATILHDTNRLSEAERLYRKSLEIYEKLDGPDHAIVASAMHNLAGLLQDTNRLPEAEALIRRALRIFELNYGVEHHLVAKSLASLARLLKNTNRFEEAETLTRRALAVCERSLGPSHPSIGTELIALAGVLIATNRHTEAEPLIRGALRNYERLLGPNHPYVATALNNLAGALNGAGRIAEAEPLVRRALKIHQHLLGPNHPDVAFSLNNLGAMLLALNRPDESEPLMRKGLEILITSSRSAGRSHPKLATAVRNYSALLAAMGWSKERISSHLVVLVQEMN